MFLKKYRVLYVSLYIFSHSTFLTSSDLNNPGSIPINITINAGSPSNTNQVEQIKTNSINQKTSEYWNILKQTLNNSCNQYLTPKFLKPLFVAAIFYSIIKYIKYLGDFKIKILNDIKIKLDQETKWIPLLENIPDINNFTGNHLFKKLAFNLYVDKHQLHNMPSNDISEDLYLINGWIELNYEINLIKKYINQYENLSYFYKMYYFLDNKYYKKLKNIKSIFKNLITDFYNILSCT